MTSIKDDSDVASTDGDTVVVSAKGDFFVVVCFT